MVKTIMSYLKYTKNHDLYYNVQKPLLRLIGYANANFEGNLGDGKSCIRFFYTLGSKVIT